METTVAEYEFDTFAVGATIKPSILDRDDHVRSVYRLQGSDCIKTGLVRELGGRFARMTRRRQDRHEPEVLIKVQPADRYCEVSPKPVAVFGTYLKQEEGRPAKTRGVHQLPWQGVLVVRVSRDTSVRGKRGGADIRPLV